MNEPPVLLTIKQVANYFGVSEATVYRWAKRKTLLIFKVGGVWRARREDIYGQHMP